MLAQDFMQLFQNELCRGRYFKLTTKMDHFCLDMWSYKIFPGVEFSTGSLGHALPVSVGIALGIRLKNIRVEFFAL